MQLTKEQKEILIGKKGRILQYAMKALINYGDSMGAKEFIDIKSAHTSFISIKYLAMIFLSKGIQPTEKDIHEFYKEISKIQVKTKTTINPGIIDLEKWKEIGASKETRKMVIDSTKLAEKCRILPTYSCIPYITDNIPMLGENCAWAETSACLYANSFLGARTNRESYETSLFSALLGITPKYGMHLDKNRSGTALIDVQCKIENLCDWGVLGFFSGEQMGLGVPVFKNLQRPTVEEGKQLASAMNVPGGFSLFHIVGVTPEAPTVEEAFKGKTPKATYIFNELAKEDIYKRINHKPNGKVDMVFLGCPHSTLKEIENICSYIKGKKVSKGTRLWIMTSYPIKASAKRLGYDKIVKESGGEILSDGCLNMYYSYDAYRENMPNLSRVATDSVKQAINVKRSFRSNVVLTDTEKCIEIAVSGGYYD